MSSGFCQPNAVFEVHDHFSGCEKKLKIKQHYFYSLY